MTDPLYALVDCWRRGEVRQIILMDHRTARVHGTGEPLRWPWSIIVEAHRTDGGYEDPYLSRYAMSGATPRHAARRALRWTRDAGYRDAVIRRWEDNTRKARGMR